MSSEWWDDFFNNLATDLAPLVSLFGESPTKQFLSESVSLIDIFIFAMAPLGIITTVVSAIRVGGSPSLRAFIGRAQEGGGNIEAELCSSTSRDVCEMYNNGGIARVFGRPKILEIVHDPHANTKDFYGLDGKEKSAGIYSFKGYIRSGKGDAEWDNVTRGRNILRYLKKLQVEPETAHSLKDSVSDSDFAPHPNLSLNVGIKKRSFIWFLLAAASGALLQSGVLVFAGLSVFAFSKRFQKNDEPADAYAFPFTLAGTLLVCIGVGMCGHIVERSTKEQIFRRKSIISGNGPRSRLFWIQPGNQVIGDQAFDPFVYNDTPGASLIEYTTSGRNTQDTELQRTNSLLVWVFVPLTVFGFILQFIGLRALHSTISIAQLGLTIIMSIIRSMLRTERLRKKDNRLGDDPDLFQGHELDWLAIEICGNSLKEEFALPQTEAQPNPTFIWQVATSLAHPRTTVFNEQLYACSDTEMTRIVLVSTNDPVIVLLSGFQSVRKSNPSDPSDPTCEDKEIHQWLAEIQRKEDTEVPRLVPRIFLSRERIARMTGVDPRFGSSRGDSSQWGEDIVTARELAETLADALRRTVDVLFSNYTKPLVLKDGWADVTTIFLALDCSVAKLSTSNKSMDYLENSQRDMVYIALSRSAADQGEIHGQWNSHTSEIEAILSLWMWSLRARACGPAKTSDSSASPKKMDLKSLRSTRLLFVSEATTNGATSSNIALHQSTLSPWLGDLATKVRGARLSYPATSGFDPTWVWTRTANRKKKAGDQSAYTPMVLHQRQRRRPTDSNEWFFGWGLLDHHTLPQQQPDWDLGALIIRTDHPPAVMCAQEIYTKLFRNLLNILEDIGGETKVMKGRHGFYLANDNITEIIRAFTDSGLGSENDARACIIPALLEKGKLPLVSMVAQARDLGDEYRRERAWKKAEEVLLWAFDTSLKSWELCRLGSEEPSREASTASEDLERELWLCAVTLCECYRWALFCEDRHSGSKQFGVEGIIKMLESKDTPPHLKNILFTYCKVALFVAEESFNLPAVHNRVTYLEQKLKDYETSSPGNANDFQGEGGSSIRDHGPSVSSLIKIDDMSSVLYHLRGPSVIEEDEGRSSLFLAAEKGWYIVVKILVEFGVAVRQSDTRARTPLHLAASSGNKYLVIYLLDQGINIDSRDDKLRTPLVIAAKHGHNEIVSILLRAGANVNVQDKNDRTSLVEAIKHRHVATVKILLKEGADANIKDASMQSPLSTAVKLSLTDVYKELLLHGADPNIKLSLLDISEELLRMLWERMKEPGFNLDEDKNDFVSRAIKFECLDIIKWIVAQTEFFISATHLIRAMDLGNTAIFQELLSSRRAMVNGELREYTPLTRAVSGGMVEFVKILLTDRDVDLDLEDGHHKTPAQWAEEMGRADLLELINKQREFRQVESTSKSI